MTLPISPRKKICLVIGYGQSNEAGTAVNPSGADVHLGGLYGYPIYRTAGQGSMFELLADHLGRDGHAVMIVNRAVGGSGMLGAWAGYARAWQANTQTFAPGAWVIPTSPNGYKYKAGGTFGVLRQSGATEPTWATGAGNTTTDNQITWTAFAADANDVVGRVYQNGMSGYDPLGYCAQVITAIQTAKSQGFEVWSIMQGHQTDSAYSVTDVAAALSPFVGRVLAAGADRVYLGITNRQIGAGNESNWDAGGFYKTLRSSVYANFLGDPRVRMGGDLSVLTDAAKTKDNGIHLTHLGVIDAEAVWYQAL